MVRRQHHLLMVPMQSGASSHIPLFIPVGTIAHIDAYYINALSGEKVAVTRLHFTGPQDLHFMASQKETFRGYSYIVEYDRSARVYRCGCLECKQTGYCLHLEQLDPHFAVA